MSDEAEPAQSPCEGRSRRQLQSHPLRARGVVVKIMALDPATKMGFAYGDAGSKPTSGSVRLKKPAETPDIAAFNAHCFLRDTLAVYAPDICIIERYLNPVAQKSADAVVLQLMVFGAIVALCHAQGVKFHTPHRATIVKHFCGRAHANGRAETKAMVLSRAHVLGYLPKDCRDDDQADAIAAWSYGECHFARVTPSELVLFGSAAA